MDKKSIQRLLSTAIAFLLFILQGFSLVIVAAENSYDMDVIQSGLEEKGVLRVGMEANYAPFNWSQTSVTDNAIEISNSPGEYANGYDLQIAVHLAEELDLELEIVKLEWDGLPPALESGMIDAIIAGMTPTPERKEQLDFSNSYYTSDLVLVVNSNSELATAQTLEDFAGMRVTGQLNMFHYDLIEQIPNVDLQTAMDSFPTMISSVLSNKSDAYISERPGALAAVAANPELTYVEFGEGDGLDTGDIDTTIAVGLRKGSPLVETINEALSTISESE